MTHEMVLTAQHPTGAQEWTCPTCGRIFVMQWQPRFKRIVLVEGDADAKHTGGTGGLSIHGVSVQTEDDLPAPFDDYFKQIGWLDS